MGMVEMKECIIVGNMGADSTADQYPEEPVCNAAFGNKNV